MTMRRATRRPDPDRRGSVFAQDRRQRRACASAAIACPRNLTADLDFGAGVTVNKIITQHPGWLP